MPLYAMFLHGLIDLLKIKNTVSSSGGIFNATAIQLLIIQLLKLKEDAWKVLAGKLLLLKRILPISHVAELPYVLDDGLENIGTFIAQSANASNSRQIDWSF